MAAMMFKSEGNWPCYLTNPNREISKQVSKPSSRETHSNATDKKIKSLLAEEIPFKERLGKYKVRW